MSTIQNAKMSNGLELHRFISEELELQISAGMEGSRGLLGVDWVQALLADKNIVPLLTCRWPCAKNLSVHIVHPNGLFL